MGQPLTKSYCCCELSTGCIIIGYLEVVAFLVGVISFAVVAALYWPDSAPDDIKRPSAIILLVAAILALASGITLLIGVHVEEPIYVLAHLIISVITLILVLTAMLIPVLTTPWWLTLIGLIFVLWPIYHWLIAFSYYVEIS